MDKKKSKVTEYCSECETEIELLHNIEKEGYKVKCPNCGARLMLCDECQHRGKEGSYMDDCDYDSQTDTCRFNTEDKVAIYFKDLTVEKQREIVRLLDGNGNYDIIPIVEIGGR